MREGPSSRNGLINMKYFSYTEDTLLKVMLMLIFFSPSISVGPREIYIFELALIVLFFVMLKRIKVKSNQLIMFFIMISLLIFLFIFQYLIHSSVYSFSNIRILFYFLMYVTFSSLNFNYSNQVETFSKCVLIVSVIGILQNIDGLIFMNQLGVNKLVAMLYPYTGTLDDDSLKKVGGLMLKMGSGFRATSTLDGHPILFGDFIAICSVSLLFLKKYKIYLVSALACVLTFSRGSWMMLILGGLLYVFLERKNLNIKKLTFYLTIAITIAIVFIMSVDSLRDAFYYRIAGSLYSFGLIDYSLSFTSTEDPRTTLVWPRFFEALDSLGIYGYLGGIPYDLDTDSGYLSMIKDGGLINLVVIVFIFIPLTMMNIRSRLNIAVMTTVFLVMMLHPLMQSYKTIAILIYISSVLSLNNKKQV